MPGDHPLHDINDIADRAAALLGAQPEEVGINARRRELVLSAEQAERLMEWAERGATCGAGLCASQRALDATREVAP